MAWATARHAPGLVVVLATGDRSYQFLTGNGLEGTLPDGLIQQIEDRIFIPYLRRSSGCRDVSRHASRCHACRNDGELRVAKKTNESEGVPWGLLLLLFGVPIGAYFYMRHLAQRARVCPRCGQKTLRRVSEDRVRLLRNGRRLPFRRCGFRLQCLWASRREPV